MTSTRDRILHLLKSRGPQTAAALARRCGVTSVAVRAQLERLAADDLAEFTEEPRGVGRPARLWRLTEQARGLFPDSHGELAVGMLAALRAAFGEDGLQRLIAERTRVQAAAYRKRVPAAETLERRVAALAALRREEGYMAEWARERDGALLLVENHCPICAAAEACQGLCAGELDLFRRVLGRGVSVERTEHLLDGSRRCVYRIR